MLNKESKFNKTCSFFDRFSPQLLAQIQYKGENTKFTGKFINNILAFRTTKGFCNTYLYEPDLNIPMSYIKQAKILPNINSKDGEDRNLGLESRFSEPQSLPP